MFKLPNGFQFLVLLKLRKKKILSMMLKHWFMGNVKNYI